MKLVIATLLSSAALVGAAHAADAVVYDAPVPVVIATYDWTGFYFGAYGAVGTGDSDLFATDGFDAATVDVSASGGFFGAQIGYDWQNGNFVFGGVADIAATNYGTDVNFNEAFEGVSASSELNYLGTVRARLGYAMDRTLFYGHGGFAYGQSNQNVWLDGVEIWDDDVSKTGWTIGAGMEYAFTDRLSLQTEYSYVDLGNSTLFDDGEFLVEDDVSFHMIKAALNFRF